MKDVSSLYIHFPFCRHLCNYCDFFKHKLTDADQVISYEELLLNQWEEQKAMISNHGLELVPLKTIYIGGGTPSLWSFKGPKFLKDFFESEGIELAESCEFTIEVDPGTWTEEEIAQWLDIGVNRFSIGSQAFAAPFLKVMDREHNLKEVKKTLDYFHKQKLNFSIDLMIGLPKINEERDLEAELDRVLEYHPKHLSVYILKARKNYAHYKNLPDDDTTADEYDFVSNYLKKSGYLHYEVSNFALPGFESKHNLKYWEYQSVLGLGPNATGLIVKEDESLRYQWKSQQVGYTEELVKGESLLIEKIYMMIRNSKGLKLSEICQFDEVAYKRIYAGWLELGYLSSSSKAEHIVLTSSGYLMCDSIVQDILDISIT